MSNTVDNRVVEMRFDNKQFESNVHTSMSTLDRLKQSLKFNGASKGLENVGSAAKNVNMMGLGSAVETVSAKFSALQVMGVTALANITNSAVNAGKRIVSALTVDPIKTGFNEYETKMNSIQTIMSNTASKGTTMSDVTRVIDELNTYADKTIYNFAEMTRNIGTFTAAGVGLEESASAIQGIANLAAASGSNSQQASTAMYQLSQALATGTVKLMDWNSVVNAGMGGEKFQEALKSTARDHGVAVDDIIKKQGSFRDSLQEGWLSADILNETLNKFTVDGATNYAKAMVESGQYTQEQADALIKEAHAMEDAATKVKTFTQLWDTLKEAAQSGWGKSWEIIVGDFDEAKALFSEISDVIGGVIGKSADARNDVLQGWKDLGGRTAIVDSLRNAFEGISSIIKPINEAFREIFPPITSQQLVSFSEGLRDLTAKLKISGDTADKIKSTFKGLFSILDIGKQAISAVLKPFAEFITGGSVSSFGDTLLTSTASIGDFFTELNAGIKAGDGFAFVSNSISGALNKLSSVASSAFNGFKGFGDILSSVGDVVSNVFGKIKDTIGNVVSWIKENISAGDIFAGLAGGGIFVAAKKFGKLIDKVKGIFDGFGSIGSGAKGKIADILDSVHGSLESFSEGIKVASLVGIAGAVMMLTSSLKKISEIEPVKIAYSLGTIRLMIASLNSGFKGLTKTLSKFNANGTIKASIAMMAMAEAVNILADAMIKMKDLSWGEITKGLAGIAGSLLSLSGALRLIGKGGVTLRTSVAILALAKACEMLSESLAKFGSMSWDEIGRGLTAMGGALGIFTASLSILSKVGGGGALLGGAGILVAVQSLDEISENLKKLGAMSWEEIKKGLAAMGGALSEFTVALSVLSKVGGFGSVLGGAGILVAVQSLDEISQNLERLGNLSWEEIKRGLTAMGGALGEFTVSLSVLSKIGGFGALLGGTGILIAVQSLDEISENLKRLGSMSWEEIGKGLTAMGGALGELSIVSGVLGKLTGLSGLVGAGSLLLGVQLLQPLVDALQQFGSMSWDEIKRGLVAMGGALTELGTVSGLLGGLTGLSGLAGSGTLLLGVQSLDKLATALQNFGTMAWDEIKRGLVAMGGALTELGVVSGLTGSLTGIAGLVGAGTITLAAQGLGQIADALQKFGSMAWDDIGHGLAAMGAALGETAIGGLLNTFSGLGSLSISTIAGPLGVLADSVKKWEGVNVPENLSYQLGSLASGIMSFTLGGLGAGALATAAPGIGQLADSIKKWSGIVIPENLETGLKSIANGVKAFSFAFTGGWSIDSINEPLSALASTVKKWNGVTIPEGIQKGLKGLADGVKAFSFSFAGGWSISAINEPLSALASTVKKWNGVTIPEGIQTKLESLANGVKAISGINVTNFAGESVNTAITNIKSLATAVSSISNLNTDGVSSFVSAINTLGTAQVDSFVNAFSSASSELASAGTKMMDSLILGLKLKQGEVKSAGTSIVDALKNAINNKKSAFRSSGQAIMSNFASGIRSQRTNVMGAVMVVLAGAANSTRSQYGNFLSAGSYVASGFASGIRSQISAAASAAASMAAAASAAARASLRIASPSKVFYGIGGYSGQGFVNALYDYNTKAYNAGFGIATYARDGLSNAISKIGRAVNGDLDMSPTIRPVLDLSNIKSGAGALNELFKDRGPIGVPSNLGMINTVMNRRRQNGETGEVVSAINKLRKDLGNFDAPSYTVNGITYDDGSNVASAVGDLIRAARIERRV